MSGQTKVKVGGIMARAGLAMVKILCPSTDSDMPAAVLHSAGKQNVNIELVVYCLDDQGMGNMVLCIDRKDLDRVEKMEMPAGAKSVTYDRGVAMLSVFGPHFRERPAISGLMFSALG